jgi:hypothetical protein
MQGVTQKKSPAPLTSAVGLDAMRKRCSGAPNSTPLEWLAINNANTLLAMHVNFISFSG